MLIASQNLRCFALIPFILLCSPSIRKYLADCPDEIRLHLFVPFVHGRFKTHISSYAVEEAQLINFDHHGIASRYSTIIAIGGDFCNSVRPGPEHHRH